jgi:acyl carrier protein
MTTTFDRLSAILIRDYKLPAEKLTLDAPLESLGIDSLGLAELLFNVEDEFKIALPPEPVALATVADVVRYIDDLVAARHSAETEGPTALTGVEPQPPVS